MFVLKKYSSCDMLFTDCFFFFYILFIIKEHIFEQKKTISHLDNFILKFSKVVTIQLQKI
ncbi:MAG TPA: hypothetical protein DEO89_03450 [Lachnospiraceae bacterium]|nr:hypothetical protein [Lachnospiraceae bacterium]